LSGNELTKRQPIKLALRLDGSALSERIAMIFREREEFVVVQTENNADFVLSANTLTMQHDKHILTPRELEVLALLAEGASNKLIARRLGISDHTVKFHVSAITKKLDAVGRTDAVAQATRLGIIHL
jgi:DNA-binding CsgD family transcriptional regulator